MTVLKGFIGSVNFRYETFQQFSETQNARALDSFDWSRFLKAAVRQVISTLRIRREDNRAHISAAELGYEVKNVRGTALGITSSSSPSMMHLNKKPRRRVPLFGRSPRMNRVNSPSEPINERVEERDSLVSGEGETLAR